MIPVTRSCISYGTGFGGWSRVAYCICAGLLSLDYEQIHLVQTVNPVINDCPLFRAGHSQTAGLPVEVTKIENHPLSLPDPIILKCVSPHIEKPPGWRKIVMQCHANEKRS
ncbi:MAG: hypothetical protein LUQ50_14710 [Methanospirillum sp.]|uniref:hypothetical protein n=1 Tax=Methanospirillum sp. TaxID=45200 RepID=UPI00236AD83C|nr:hypothetical protein [Methanospirillum sp.]MDD1730304.1 hypothetical protein [Methanospirillum sp.]